MLLLLLPIQALAGANCVGGESYALLSHAIADESCNEVRLEGGFIEEILISRDLTIVGEGSDKTYLVCKGSPCVSISDGADVSISGITISGEKVAISARYSALSLEDVHLVPFADIHGGWLRVRDTDTTLRNVEIVMTGRRPTAVEAISGVGHDMNIHDARFLGLPPRSGTLSAVYSLNYGVHCVECTFSERRPPSWIPWGEIEIKLEEIEIHTNTGTGKTARWPQLNCPAASEADELSCDEQCGKEPVAACRMTYQEATEVCIPIARCVEDGETLER